MLNITKTLIIASATAAMGLAAPAAWSKTPEGKDAFMVIPSAPQKPGENLYSITARWRIDQDLTYESSGMAFVKGPEMDSPDTGKSVSHKIAMGLNDGLVDQYPKWRGVLIGEATADDGSDAFNVSNKAGFSFMHVTLRDYTNQTTRLVSRASSFKAGSIKLAIDVVSAAAVDNPMAAAMGAQKRSYDSTNGAIEITLGDGKTVRVETDGKKSKQIEKELASKINEATLSSSSIAPHTKDGDARNLKPFDGSELELLSLDTNTITVSVTDPKLGVLYKFVYLDDNGAGTDYMIMLPGLLIFGGLASLIFITLNNKRKNKQAESEEA